MTSATCKTCRFFKAEKPDFAKRVMGECRQAAPIMTVQRSSCSTYWAPGWPVVRSTDWCGQFAVRAKTTKDILT